MTGWAKVRGVARAHPHAADVVLAAFVFALTLAATHGPSDRYDRGFVVTGGSVVVGVLICAALVFRRRWPLPVLAFTTAGTAVAVVITDARTPYGLVVAVAAFAVATRSERNLAWLTGLSAGLVLLIVAVIATPEPWSNPRDLGFIAWVALATALGDAVRSRRAFVASIEERAVRAERTREEEARRQVAEERLRIARELHDIVAHHIAVITVQAGVASHLLTTRPEAADVALGHVRAAGRSVLEELGSLLGVLRQSGEAPAPAEPAPGLGRLDSLVDSFVQAGLHVDLTTSGRVRPASGAVDLAAYRIIQESLTNAHKHGGGGASVRVDHRPDTLCLEIRNPGPQTAPAPSTSTGHGLIGMHERAVSVGGTLQAGAQPDGGFRVAAVLPRPEAG
jgi:signal transduction histidine kinase